MRIDISALDRKTFWAAAEAIDLGRVKTDQEGNEYLLTTRFVDVHDNAGAGQVIETTPAVYDNADNLVAPAIIAKGYHATIVIADTAASDPRNDIAGKMKLWAMFGKSVNVGGKASGMKASGVTMITGIRTPQHGVAE